jgi:peptide deformylase
VATRRQVRKMPSRPISGGANECPKRREGRNCARLNQVLIHDAESGAVLAYAACSCGRRYPLTGSPVQRLLERSKAFAPLVSGIDSVIARALDQIIRDGTWPADHVSRHSKVGIVPIGRPVLHAPTKVVPLITPALADFGNHMIKVMNQAGGIGLAANQAGVGLRMLVHNLGAVAPQILINPEVLQSAGKWEYSEACLSLKLEGTAATVLRPKRITIRAAMLDGKSIVMNADEIFARVLQHEIDHLDGIEYVQRVDGETRLQIYRLIEERGIDVSCIPPRPYSALK